MKNAPLQNYLRTFRRRTGLTQEELGFLLSEDVQVNISRLERGTRMPSIQQLFALELVFRSSSNELFAGLRATVDQITSQRARALLGYLQRKKPTEGIRQKILWLEETLDEHEPLPDSNDGIPSASSFG